MKSEFRSLHIFYDHKDLGFWTGYMTRRKSQPAMPSYVSCCDFLKVELIMIFINFLLFLLH